MKFGIPAFILLLFLLFGHIGESVALDQAKCDSANSRQKSTYSYYQSAKTAYDYCQRYGDTSGTGYGSKDCSSAYSKQQSTKSAYDNAVSDQWQYCY